VFSCTLDPHKNSDKQPLYHLQVTFAALQEAQLKAFSPIDLVKSLDIDTTDQQDAQEYVGCTDCFEGCHLTDQYLNLNSDLQNC